ncbi:MAG: heavy metal translocating P-type ATPase, partial [Rhodoferax sp.]|nr:heavy metal translocating P-type ATPase [Rhodoferax sp.]
MSTTASTCQNDHHHGRNHGDPHKGPVPEAGSSVAVLAVPDMCCPTESGMVEKALRRLHGVTSITPDLMRRQVRVEYTGATEAELLAAARHSGLAVELQVEALPVPGKFDRSGMVQAQAPTSPRHPPSYWKLILGGVVAAAAEALAFSLGDAHWGVIGLALGTIALTGLGTYKKGWFAVRQLNLNINALMSVAVTGAVAIGRWPEAAMVMFLFAVAEMIEAKSLDRARRAVEGLMAMTPETATVKVADSWEVVPAASVAIGTLVRARPGERIALDGQLVNGATTVDQAPITGESLPIDKS